MATRKRPSSPLLEESQPKRTNALEEGEEIDPLDAFMAEVHEEVRTQLTQPKAVRLHEAARCDDFADPVAEFMEARKDRGVSSAMMAALRTGNKEDSDDEVYAAAKVADQELEAEYDSEDQLIITKREIGLIAAVDHEAIDYEPFAKDFYEPIGDIKLKTKDEVGALRELHGIKVGGYEVASPLESFFQCGFDLSLLSVIRKQNYEKPTPIQMQTLPVALSGRDLVGLAKTGSGKTAAYLLPLCVHVAAAAALKKGEGPIALILAPTRELSEQIHKQARIFGKPYAISVAACFGGLSKYDQIKALKAGSDAAVATPGRMIDLIKAKACSMRTCTFVVLDEADRMFDMGLEKQVRCILAQIRPDRQTMLFSATMPHKVERLCRDVLTNPVRISIGRVGAANEDIQQRVEVLKTDLDKHLWLATHLSTLVDMGEVLIFANQKQRVEEVMEKLQQSGFRVGAIHGDMDQHSRMQILQSFRNEVYHVLVATDVAARGLDIPTIKTVINFDVSKDMDGHTHRIGRTGRAGDKEGTAYTLITPQQTRQAVFLVNSLTAAGQDVTEALHGVAMKDQRFAKGIGKKGMGRKGAGRVGGSGLGFTAASKDPHEAAADFTPSHTKMESEWMSSMGATEVRQPTLVPPLEVQRPAPVPPTAPRPATPSVIHHSFVSSGVQGGGEKQKATIVAPKRASTTYVPAAPIPVTQRPLVPAHRGHSRPSTQPRQFQSSHSTGNEFQKAFAVAQEIAARFGGSVAKGDTPQAKHP